MKITSLLLTLLVSFSAFAVEPVLEKRTPAVAGTFMIDKFIWNSSYLALNKNTMVHGEEYNGYPGPLPKFFYALGYDVNHPSIDWELLQRVDRDAPNWFGICNGWAVAAITYDEPQQVTINGMKLNVGDLKAMLTAIHKDNAAFFLGGRGEDGVTASEFHSIIHNSVAKGEPVIFDVDISSEIWNYPTAGVTVETAPDGPWTNVTATVHYANLTPLNDVTGIELFNNIVVTYRYDTDSLSNYEYTGASIDDHPNRSWVDNVPYLLDRWIVRANHHFTLELYNELMSSPGFGNPADVFEPNETADQAHQIRQEFIYASLLTDDVDHYRFSLQAGQPLVLEVDVYEGAGFDLALTTPSGATLTSATATTGEMIDMVAPESGDYLLRIIPNADRPREAFYRVSFPEDAGSFWLNPHQQGDASLQVQALHTRDQAAFVGNQQVAAYGSTPLASKPSFVRATDRTIWSESWRVGEGMHKKKYHRDHVLRSKYVVPHVTFRNGWKTRIEVLAEKPGVPVFLQTHGADGAPLRRTPLPLNDQGWFEGYISDIPAIGLTGAAWFEIETEQDNRLKGTVCFENVRGNYVMIDLQPTPSIGEFLVFDLKRSEHGGTGLAVVNTAPVENQILWELRDRDENVITEGGGFLQPGEKILDTIAGYTGAVIDEEHVFHMHSQYPVEGVVIQYQAEPYFMYGHRLMRRDVDNLKETYIALPQDRTLATFLFANFSGNQIQPLFEGFDAQGNLMGRFNVNLQRRFADKEIRFFDLATLFQNGVDIIDLDAITHLRVSSGSPFMAVELLGEPGTSTYMGVPLVNVYDQP